MWALLEIVEGALGEQRVRLDQLHFVSLLSLLLAFLFLLVTQELGKHAQTRSCATLQKFPPRPKKEKSLSIKKHEEVREGSPVL